MATSFKLRLEVLALFIGALLTLNGLDHAMVEPFLRGGKIRYLALSVAVIAFFFFWRRLSWAPALFAALAILSFSGHNYDAYATFPLLLILGVLTLAAAIVGCGKVFLADLMILTGAFEAGTALAQVAGLHPLFMPLSLAERNAAIGFIGDTSNLGILLVACLCPALWKRQYTLSALMIAGCLATGSSMTLGSLSIVLALYLWQAFGFRLAAIYATLGASLIGLSFYIFPETKLFSLTGRSYIWGLGRRAFWENPLYGSGLGSWAGHFAKAWEKEILAVNDDHVPRQLHCDYLDFLVEFGALAAPPFVAAFLEFCWNFRPTWTHAAVAAILVNALANFPLSTPQGALIFVCCWAFSVPTEGKWKSF